MKTAITTATALLLALAPAVALADAAPGPDDDDTTAAVDDECTVAYQESRGHSCEECAVPEDDPTYCEDLYEGTAVEFVCVMEDGAGDGTSSTQVWCEMASPPPVACNAGVAPPLPTAIALAALAGVLGVVLADRRRR